jgi:hypothetical protein
MVRAGASETASSGSSGAPEGQVSSAIIESMQVCCTRRYLIMLIVGLQFTGCAFMKPTTAI